MNPVMVATAAVDKLNGNNSTPDNVALAPFMAWKYNGM